MKAPFGPCTPMVHTVSRGQGGLCPNGIFTPCKIVHQHGVRGKSPVPNQDIIFICHPKTICSAPAHIAHLTTNGSPLGLQPRSSSGATGRSTVVRMTGLDLNTLFVASPQATSRSAIQYRLTVPQANSALGFPIILRSSTPHLILVLATSYYMSAP